ncbi:hypothetical protein V6N12_045735 [Hibiscus sabdariffa]|uniref:Uncharacterized protein n=1 Tax=Hibiscus sabdariffa TaxID=183260 RepID=A0ABR2G483_9ROSI
MKGGVGGCSVVAAHSFPQIVVVAICFLPPRWSDMAGGGGRASGHRAVVGSLSRDELTELEVSWIELN